MDRVLIVDDDPDIIFAIKTLLKREKIRVYAHNSGFGLVDAVRQHCPDLVLLDISMPGLSGQSALHILNDMAAKYQLTTRVIFYSAHSEETLQEAVRACGADGYIPKTLPAPQVVSRILGYLKDPDGPSEESQVLAG